MFIVVHRKDCISLYSYLALSQVDLYVALHYNFLMPISTPEFQKKKGKVRNEIGLLLH